MDFDELEQHADLVQALVGRKYYHEYHEYSAFRHSIDYLAKILPLWVEGLALAGFKEEQRVEQLRAEIMKAPPKPLLFPNPGIDDRREQHDPAS